jgi:hypothetical protein
LVLLRSTYRDKKVVGVFVRFSVRPSFVVRNSGRKTFSLKYAVGSASESHHEIHHLGISFYFTFKIKKTVFL